MPGLLLHFLKKKQENKQTDKPDERVRENKDFCNIIMPSKNTKILEFNQYQKCDKAPFFIYSDLQSIIERIHGYKNNPKNSSTAKLSEHIPSGF